MIQSLLSLILSTYFYTSINQDKKPPIIINQFFHSNPPQKQSEKISPVLTAQSSLSIDINSGEILYQKDIHKRLPIASLTKLMTALIILEENTLDEIVHVPNNIHTILGSKMQLYPGEKISVKNLIIGLLVKSGNDAATALAVHNAGSVHDFVKKMNLRSKLLGLENTRFQNPIGFDHPNNYSSAYDLSKIANLLYQSPLVREIITIKSTELKSSNEKIVHKIENTNKLLGHYFNIKGFKTGKTENAKECLILIADNNTENNILTIILGSENRFYDTKILLGWSFNSYLW